MEAAADSSDLPDNENCSSFFITSALKSSMTWAAEFHSSFQLCLLRRHWLMCFGSWFSFINNLKFERNIGDAWCKWSQWILVLIASLGWQPSASAVFCEGTGELEASTLNFSRQSWFFLLCCQSSLMERWTTPSAESAAMLVCLQNINLL